MLDWINGSTIKSVGFAALVLLTTVGCSSTSSSYSPFLYAEPAVGAQLTRVPRTLRLFYAALPDVPKSNVTLTGPTGEHQLRGMHTMGADDLMIEILDPATAGEYKVEWTAVVGDDPTTYEGFYTFSVAPQ
ncbi:MAG: methionine-rich copper-binding protein CopC [Pseudohongiellaceae bacterium]|jgi:methionine-rich copper-binding protein CopC